MNTRGFTLIELMIVVAIIAVIFVIAFRAYKDKTTLRDEVPGFNVITDATTGCQYLRPKYGTNAPIVQRFGPDGNQVCVPPTVEVSR